MEEQEIQYNRNINNTRNCFGCGVCSVVCKQHIIEIVLNRDGFYEPKITDETRCTQCGLCQIVCSFRYKDLGQPMPVLHAYGAWSRSSELRRKCTSGGVSFELCRKAISQNYMVCAVRYNLVSNQPEHFIATSPEQLEESIGSKYVQSYTPKAFSSIDRRNKYLVTGTPCQIDSFRRYIKQYHCEDNFLLMDFYCHGIPSRWLWDKYVSDAECDIGKLTKVEWRYKGRGWQHSYAMRLNGIKGKRCTNLLDGDIFYRYFFSDACLNRACYNHCRFRYNQSSADIRIGDAWGDYYKEESEGVNVVIAFTQKGDTFLHDSNCEIQPIPFETAVQGQMKRNPTMPDWYDKVMRLLQGDGDLEGIFSKIAWFQRKDRWRKKMQFIVRHITKTKKNDGY